MCIKGALTQPDQNSFYFPTPTFFADMPPKDTRTNRKTWKGRRARSDQLIKIRNLNNTDEF